MLEQTIDDWNDLLATFDKFLSDQHWHSLHLDQAIEALVLLVKLYRRLSVLNRHLKSQSTHPVSKALGRLWPDVFDAECQMNFESVRNKGSVLVDVVF